MSGDQDHAQVAVPPPLVFLVYLGGALFLYWVVPFSLPWAGIMRAAGAMTIAVGLLLGFWALLHMIRRHTSPNPHEPTSVLVTDGPYAISRNPIYGGYFLIFLGFTFLAGTVWGIVLSPLLIVTTDRALVHAEEAYREGKFGQEYARYRASVRRWL